MTDIAEKERQFQDELRGVIRDVRQAELEQLEHEIARARGFCVACLRRTQCLCGGTL